MLALTRDLCAFRTAVVADDNEALFAPIGRGLPLEFFRFASGDTFNGWQVPQNWRVRAKLLWTASCSMERARPWPSPTLAPLDSLARRRPPTSGPTTK
jgi:hypothetical protein